MKMKLVSINIELVENALSVKIYIIATSHCLISVFDREFQSNA